MGHPALAAALLACLVSAPATAQEHPIDAAAMKALRETVKSYRERTALTVRTTVKIEVGEGDAASRTQPEIKAEITFVPDGRGVAKVRGFTCYVGGGELKVVHDEVDHSYFSMSDDGSPYYALLTSFLDLPFPHLAIAFGEADVDEFFCMQFHPKAPWARPTSVADVTADDGERLRRIRMTSDHATVDVMVDPATKLIRSIEAKVTGGDLVASGTTLTYRHAYEYETYEKTPFDPAVLTFDPQRRQRVDMMAALAPPPPATPPGRDGPEAGALVGKPAPPFVLATADGGAIDLHDLQGQVVVLDFWATWCAPCRAALPELHELARWAAGNAVRARVITVNSFEKHPPDNTPDARLESVRKFWEANRFTLPVVMDYTDEVARAYGVQGIPATFVIRSDGVVHATHSGFGGEYQAQLRAEIEAALAAVEAPAERP